MLFALSLSDRDGHAVPSRRRGNGTKSRKTGGTVVWLDASWWWSMFHIEIQENMEVDPAAKKARTTAFLLMSRVVLFSE